ncbi:amidohydrolase family protein [Termitidicoccus mucosus]|uniref:Adenine deaminase n=1 Tax=Termitidicoccus mucosus TaxID=1184151 RepID=A0A178ID86_9BACT|nr:adenosine deaminase [Opitutaceae bacterium TSB47]
MKLTRFSIKPLHRMTRALAAVAMGREAPDLVITGARVLSTYTERIHDNREIWIKGGRIAAVKAAGSFRGTSGKPGAKSPASHYDARGGILAPGLVDPHIHIESAMMTACAYAEAALLNGTTTIFCDSHEIGNVCDTAGIEWMLADARQAPLSIFLTVPSTVPATNPRLETAGGDLTPKKIGRLFDRWPEAVALGEKMDFVPVAMGDRRSHAVLAEALKRGRPVCGHIYGREFVAAGAASGITDTHEAIDRDIADDFLEAGVWVFLRGGPPTTPWHSLPEAIKTVTELGANPKRVCVCTDDRDADDLFLFGMDWVARQAVAAGMPPVTAWSMGSLHPATRYAKDGDIGGLGHGRRADIVLLNDALEVQNTWFGGELVVENKKITRILDAALSKRYKYPKPAYNTVRLPAGKIRLTPGLPEAPVTAHVIRAALPGIVLFHDRLRLEPAPGETWADLFRRHDLCFVTVVERHGKNGGVAHGLLRAFGLRDGAVASSVGHDAHNIIIAGTGEADMRLALATLKKLRGGVCVVRGGKVIASVALPVAGLLSDKRATAVAKESAALKKAWAAAGCALPYMGFNLIPLSVIPEIRITDKGLVLVPEMKIVPLFEKT